MKIRNSKGFTIVELVIIIAIIAILAAVLIPTFSNMITGANASVDKQLITNLNMALTIDAATAGKHPTMHAAVCVAMAAGYNIEAINASAYASEILWDSLNDLFVYRQNGRIVYVNEGSDTTEPDDDLSRYWAIADKMPDTPTFSLYAGKNWTDTEVAVTVGFDAGFNTDIETVTYTGTSVNTVILRTNGGELTVNAPDTTVDHYGFATACRVGDAAAYNEHGTVGRLIYSAAAGRIAFKSGSTVYCYMNTTGNAGADAGPATKESGATVYTDVKAGATVATGYVEGKNPVVVKDGIVDIHTCFNHAEGFGVENVGEYVYLLCKCCGAFARFDAAGRFRPTTSENELSLSFTIVPVEGVMITASTEKMRQGESFRFAAKVYPDNVSFADIVWSVSEDCAVVDETGLVTVTGGSAGDTFRVIASAKSNLEKTAAIAVTIVDEAVEDIPPVEVPPDDATAMVTYFEKDSGAEESEKSKYFSTLGDAVRFANTIRLSQGARIGTLRLLRDDTLDQDVTLRDGAPNGDDSYDLYIAHGVTLDLGGHTLAIPHSIHTSPGGRTTIRNGTLDQTKYESGLPEFIRVYDGVDLELDGVTIKNEEMPCATLMDVGGGNAAITVTINDSALCGGIVIRRHGEVTCTNVTSSVEFFDKRHTDDLQCFSLYDQAKLTVNSGEYVSARAVFKFVFSHDDDDGDFAVDLLVNDGNFVASTDDLMILGRYASIFTVAAEWNGYFQDQYFEHLRNYTYDSKISFGMVKGGTFNVGDPTGAIFGQDPQVFSPTNEYADGPMVYCYWCLNYRPLEKQEVHWIYIFQPNDNVVPEGYTVNFYGRDFGEKYCRWEVVEASAEQSTSEETPPETLFIEE